MLIVALVIHGTATKLKTPRNIAISGAISGNANFDGSGNVNIVTKQANVSVLTGELTIPASTSNNKIITYPLGYNKANCIEISTAIMNKTNETKGYNYVGLYTNSSDGLANAYYRRLNLIDSGINLYVTNPNTSNITVLYKIVLMKIS